MKTPNHYSSMAVVEPRRPTVEDLHPIQVPLAQVGMVDLEDSRSTARDHYHHLNDPSHDHDPGLNQDPQVHAEAGIDPLRVETSDVGSVVGGVGFFAMDPQVHPMMQGARTMVDDHDSPRDQRDAHPSS